MSRRLIFPFLSFCFLVNLAVTAQESEVLMLEATIVDFETSEPLPYVTVYNLGNGTGTVSNNEGFFRLAGVSTEDTVRFSFVGYTTLKLSGSELQRSNRTLKLERKPAMLSEFTLLGDWSVLYKLIQRARKAQTYRKQSAKTYFSLESFANDQRVELLECYYNGHFAGYDIQKLELKNGRIALAEFGNRFFVSTESSKAIYSHELFGDNPYFPASPFQLTKGRLKKDYDLRLLSKYKDEQDNLIFVIDFTPRDSTDDLFSGQVWIDSLTADIYKVNLQKRSAKNHPFLPMGNVKRLDRIDLDITKNFKPADKGMIFESVNFDYSVHYTTNKSEKLVTDTRAVLIGYNSEELFRLPQFDFIDARYGDYVKINAAPYNAFFWENMNEFADDSRAEKNQLFLPGNSALTDRDMFGDNEFFVGGVLQQPYVHWNGDPVFLAGGGAIKTPREEWQGTLPSERYALTVKYYLDINSFDNELHFLSANVLDPFETYYDYKMNPVDHMFVNMYFDLFEIHYREMVKALERCDCDESRMEEIFDEYTEKAKEQGKLFRYEVNRGKNWGQMEKWDRHIFDVLQISNIERFQGK